MIVAYWTTDNHSYVDIGRKSYKSVQKNGGDLAYQRGSCLSDCWLIVPNTAQDAEENAAGLAEIARQREELNRREWLLL